MTIEERREILKLLDMERQTVIYRGVVRSSDIGVIKDISTDGKNCEIVYSSCSKDQVDHVIAHQIQAARMAGYELEWKVYEHDQPHCLGERLIAAGFDAEDREAFMVLTASNEALHRFGAISGDIRRVTNNEGLQDYQTIVEENDGESCENQIERYAFMLENHPDNLSIYVAYVDDEPAACGRIYFHKDSKCATVHGANTRKQFRQRGLYTQMVAIRLREAISRGIDCVYTDALPTSEPILSKRGFEIVTHTQPFCFKV